MTITVPAVDSPLKVKVQRQLLVGAGMLLAPELYAEELGLPPPAAGVDAGMAGGAEGDEQSFPRHSGAPVMDVEALRLAATDPAAMVVAGEDARTQAGKGAAVPPLPGVTSETKAGFELPGSAAGATKEGIFVPHFNAESSALGLPTWR